MGDETRAQAAQRLTQLTAAQRTLLERRLLARSAQEARRRRITRRPGDGPAVLSPAQEMLWLLSQVFDDGLAYNAPSAYRLEGPLDLDLLARAFAALAERHEILRTTYSVMDGTPMQIVTPSGPVPMRVVDLRAHPADVREAESQRILTEEARFRFDLEHGPVLRPVVVRLADDEHILMLNLHHIATDGYSRSTIFRDLTALYDALADGVPSPLPPPALQYADYAVWQRAWLGDGVAERQLAYWKERLRGAPSRLDLPTDFPRPPVRAYVGDHVSMMLQVAVREALRAGARAQDATLFVALLALFATLLGRYARQEDVVIGTPFGGRGRTELDDMVGYMVNPLALRVDLSGDPTFTELLARTRQTVVDAFAHADVPYEWVVRAANPERDLSQTPVFQAMIVFHNPSWLTQRPKFTPRGVRCTEITHERGWSKFDLLIGMSERTTGLNTTWEYSTELFALDTVRRMMDHFRTLAASAAATPERRLSRLSMLSEGERARLLGAFAASGAPTRGGPSVIQRSEVEPTSTPPSVVERFEAQVRRTPSAPAVTCGPVTLTYAQLNARANRIAWLLRERGVRPGTLVGVLMDKTPDLVPAVLGVLKSGGAYIPLDPLYPADRLAFMVGDARPALVLTAQAHLALDLRAGAPERIALDAPGTLDPYPEDDPPATAGEDDLAYVIYTSGSTGHPKGAMIARGSLAGAYAAYERAYRLRELRAHLQMASFSFDVFTGDLIRALLAGATLVLCPLDTVIDPAALYGLMVRECVDAAEFVPATAALLFDWCRREGHRLDHMRLVIISSEAWRTEHYALYRSLCGPHTRLLNAYGLTEATIDSTWYEPGEGDEMVPGRFVPIGRPLENTRVYIVDEHLEPQPVGLAGELCIGGPAVARGYLNRPELTAARFVADPFAGPGGGRLYRTGDLARFRPDGTIEFLGRADRQIKIRGFRIEPGEIEAVLESLPEVREAAVVDRPDPDGEVRLVAYISRRDTAAPAESLRQALAERLPAYMIPGLFVDVERIPHTPNGKVDRAGLPEPVWTATVTAGTAGAPSTETERRLAAIWSAVLRVGEISVHDNFFALGGHSLMAMQVLSRARDELGAPLTLRSIFDAPTVAELAAEADRLHATRIPVAAPALIPVTRARRRAGTG